MYKNMTLWVLILINLLSRVQSLCDQPPPVANAEVFITFVNNVLKAEYNCHSDTGYVTRGNNSITCLRQDGEDVWSPVSIICERVRCRDAPPSMPHATHNFYATVTKSRTVVEYYQGTGYTRGVRDRTVYFTRREGRTLYYSNFVTYTCEDLFSLPDGSHLVRSYCGEDGGWIPADMFCGGAGCGDLPVVNNTQGDATIQTGDQLGNTATYSCLDGFEISNGSAQTICQSNGEWSTPPVCTRKICGPPPDIAHGRISSLTYSTTFGSEVAYTCDSSYFSVVGSLTVICSADGTWSTPPTCQKRYGHSTINLNSTTTTADSQNVKASLGARGLAGQTKTWVVSGSVLAAGVVTCCLLVAVWFIRNKRKYRKPPFMSVDNVLYKSEQQLVTVCSAQNKVTSEE